MYILYPNLQTARTLIEVAILLQTWFLLKNSIDEFPQTFLAVGYAFGYYIMYIHRYPTGGNYFVILGGLNEHRETDEGMHQKCGNGFEL